MTEPGLKNKLLISLGAAVAFIALLVIFEISLRFFAEPAKRRGLPVYGSFMREGQIAEYQEMYHWRLLPNSRAVSANGTVYEINSQGCRGPEFSRKKPGSTYRILTAGDSCYFGWEVSEEESLPGRLRIMFSEDSFSKRIEVINCGAIGRTLYQGLLELKQRLLEYYPDMILLGFGWNDASPPGRGRLTDAEYHELSTRLAFRLANAFRKSYLYRNLVGLFGAQEDDGSWMLGAMKDRNGNRVTTMLQDAEIDKNVATVLPKYVDAGCENDEGYNGGGSGSRTPLPLYRKCLEEYVEICRENEVALAFLPVSIPWDYFAAMRETARKQEIEIFNADKILWQVCRSKCSDKNVKLRDRESWTVCGRGIYLFDGCHPTPAGFRLIAAKIYPSLAALVHEEINKQGQF